MSGHPSVAGLEDNMSSPPISTSDNASHPAALVHYINGRKGRVALVGGYATAQACAHHVQLAWRRRRCQQYFRIQSA